jgi:hypothetical protein
MPDLQVKFFIFRTLSRTTNFSTDVTLRTDSPMKMEQTECSETLVFKVQTPGNNPKENIRQNSLSLHVSPLMTPYPTFVPWLQKVQLFCVISFSEARSTLLM